MINLSLSSSNETKQTGFYYGYAILLFSFIIYVTIAGTQYSFGVFFKPVLNEFGWTRAATSGAYSLNMVFNGLTGILAGRLSDRFGPRLVLSVGGFFIGLGYLLMSQVHAIWQIYLFFGVLVSIGMGAMAVPLLSTVARWFSKKRGLATGIVVAGAGLGMVTMPPLANLLISSYNWRTSYVILGVIAIALIIILAQFIRRPPSQVGGLSRTANTVKTDHSILQVQGLSLQEAFRTRAFWIICAISLFSAFGVQTVMVHVVAHATDIEITAAAAAFILSVIGVVSIGGKVGMGGLVDKIGIKRILIMIFILTTLSFVWLRIANELWMLYFFAVLFGFSYGGFAAVQSPLVADIFGLKAHGAIFGVTMFALSLGGATGPLVAGRIFDTSGNYDWAFILCAALGIAGLILSILLKAVRK